MNRQPEALRLADALDADFVQGRISNHNGRKAAIELRRLHALNQELLEALKLAMPDLHGYWRIKAEEVIAKAEDAPW